MTDTATQRKFMVDTQVRPSDVTDRRIIQAMLEVPREAYVPAALQPIAYMDEQLRVAGTGAGRYLLAPRTLAKLLQNLDVAANSVVLDLGGATGYSAAVLAKLAGRVVMVEPDQGLAGYARDQLHHSPLVKIIVGDATAGAAADGPFDAILINGAIEVVPPALLDQLKDGGRLAAIQVETGIGRATLWRRFGMKFDRRTLFDQVT